MPRGSSHGSSSHGPSRRPSGPRRPDRKTLQLCEQVRQTLEYVLTGELDDDLLRTLYVAKVEPAPDAGRLLVTVVPLAGLATAAEPLDPVAVVTRLHARAGELRSAVAGSISRRKVPDLMYRFAADDPAAGEAPKRPAAEEE